MRKQEATSISDVCATAALGTVRWISFRFRNSSKASFILFALPVDRGRKVTMKYRALGRTGWRVSEVSFGAWAIGGFWGHVSDEEAMKTLHKAIDSGVNFIDTADVYGDGRSERLIARLKKERKDEIVIATKAGRRCRSK
jgi:hypothetical protein